MRTDARHRQVVGDAGGDLANLVEGDRVERRDRAVRRLVNAVTPPIAPPAPPTDQPPATIEVGQTVDQVVAILGQPQKIVKLAAKQIYIFKDLKVTFDKGKVSDVQ